MSNKMYALGRLKTGQMNKTEMAYEAHLFMLKVAGEVLWYKFDSINLRLADNTFYKPDFLVMKSNGEIEIHEVKGSESVFMDDAKVKIKVASSIFPFKFFSVIPLKVNKKIKWIYKEY